MDSPNHNNVTDVPDIENLTDIKVKWTRNLEEPYNTIVKVLSIALALYVLYGGLFGTTVPFYHRVNFMAFVLPIVFFKYPVLRKYSYQTRPTWLDFLLMAASTFCIAVIWLNKTRYTWRMPLSGVIEPIDIIWGILFVLIVFEACRRVLGLALPIIGAVFISYGLWGSNLPGILRHGGTSFIRLLEFVTLTTDGVFSSITGIGATFLFTFIAFGTFLRLNGMGDVIFNIAKYIARDSLGAAAKIAVISSAAMASISGSAIANVITTGSITIPIMKREGFKPYEAAAFETAASVGGQITPPIMGAGIFIMAEVTGIPLVRLMGYSIIPAFLYFLSVFVFVHNRIQIRTKRNELVRLAEEEWAKISLPRELKKGFILILPVVLLVYMMLRGYSPYYSSCAAIILGIVISAFFKSTRMGVKEILNWLNESTSSALAVAVILATAAIIIAIIYTTGFIAIVSSAIIALSGGNVFIMLVLIILMSYILGMSLPTTAAYILISLLGVPSLAQVGVPVLAAHMAIFWFSQDSAITPPVCITAFCAADIAEAPRIKSALTSLMFAKGLYLIPFMMVYANILESSLLEKLVDGTIIALSFVAIAIALDGFWANSYINLCGRIVSAAAAVFLIWGVTFDVTSFEGLPMIAVGLALFVGITFINRIPFCKNTFCKG